MYTCVYILYIYIYIFICVDISYIYIYIYIYIGPPGSRCPACPWRGAPFGRTACVFNRVLEFVACVVRCC